MTKSCVKRISGNLDKEIQSTMKKYNIESYITAQELLLSDIRKLREQNNRIGKKHIRL